MQVAKKTNLKSMTPAHLLIDREEKAFRYKLNLAIFRAA